MYLPLPTPTPTPSRHRCANILLDTSRYPASCVSEKQPLVCLLSPGAWLPSSLPALGSAPSRCDYCFLQRSCPGPCLNHRPCPHPILGTNFILQPQSLDHRVETAEEPAGQLNPLQPALPPPGTEPASPTAGAGVLTPVYIKAPDTRGSPGSRCQSTPEQRPGNRGEMPAESEGGARPSPHAAFPPGPASSPRL